MKGIDFVHALCEEFTDVVITDKKKSSIILNIPSKYFKELNKRLIAKGFELTFKKAVSKNNITASYSLKKKK
ncbi:MAG: hypothetical protein EBU90_21545 [Proteobacteria bacterium]|nr:hypothetical protein [Pseudomonadota bacterium]NBP15621.1 hypothetical protein [bacterium]